MQYGICIPNFGIFSDICLIIEMAQDAEQAGWDGFFIWDHISFGLHKMPMVDPWIALTAIAIKTERLRIGPMVTPLPRRRPWKVAREATSLDHLSGGRVILGVGAGAGPYSWDNLGEVTDPKERSIMLDEALEVLVGLWSGEPLNYHGTHYTIHDTIYVPTPVQIPRIPIWVPCIELFLLRYGAQKCHRSASTGSGRICPLPDALLPGKQPRHTS